MMKTICNTAGLALLAVLSLVLVGSPAINALPAYSVTTNFYSEPAMINQVGWQMTLRCFGGSGPVYGEVSDFAIQYMDPCDVGSNRSAACVEYSWSCPDGTANPQTCYQVAPPHEITCPEWVIYQ